MVSGDCNTFKPTLRDILFLSDAGMYMYSQNRKEYQTIT